MSQCLGSSVHQEPVRLAWADESREPEAQMRTEETSRRKSFCAVALEFNAVDPMGSAIQMV